MDEGVIEGGEDPGYTKDIFTCRKTSILYMTMTKFANLLELEDREIYSQSRGVQPSSWEAF